MMKNIQNIEKEMRKLNVKFTQNERTMIEEVTTMQDSSIQDFIKVSYLQGCELCQKGRYGFITECLPFIPGNPENPEKITIEIDEVYFKSVQSWSKKHHVEPPEFIRASVMHSVQTNNIPDMENQANRQLALE